MNVESNARPPLYNPIIPTRQTPAASATGSTPLRSVEALHALYTLLGDYALVDALVNAYTTWEEMATAERSQMAYAVGAWAAQLRLTPHCPTMPNLGENVHAFSRYGPGYPLTLLELPDAPSVLYVKGRIPSGPTLAIDGATRPTQAGLAAARAAASVAAKQGIVVVASLDTGVGRVALETALRAGGRVIGVAASDVTKAGISAGLAELIPLQNGAVVSEWGPGLKNTEQHVLLTSRLVVALARAFFSPEAGTTPLAGINLVRTAIALNIPIIIPRPDRDAFVDPTKNVNNLLSAAHRYSEPLLGTSTNIQTRLARGEGAADVVEDSEQLARCLWAALGTQAPEPQVAGAQTPPPALKGLRDALDN